jgi:hypothetical protein
MRDPRLAVHEPLDLGMERKCAVLGALRATAKVLEEGLVSGDARKEGRVWRRTWQAYSVGHTGRWKVLWKVWR